MPVVETTRAWTHWEGDVWEKPGAQVQIIRYVFPDTYLVRNGGVFGTESLQLTAQGVRDLTQGMTQVQAAGYSIDSKSIYELLDRCRELKSLAPVPERGCGLKAYD